MIDAPALGVRRSGADRPFNPSLFAAMPGTGPRQDATLGSMGDRGVAASPHIGRAAVWMEGDLSPQDWNRPDNRRARAAVIWGMN